MPLLPEDKIVLANLAARKYDGFVGETCSVYYENDCTRFHWRKIKNGIPSTHTRRLYADDHQIYPENCTDRYYETDEDKLLFLGRLGIFIEDEDIYNFLMVHDPKEFSYIKEIKKAGFDIKDFESLEDTEE